MFLNALTKLIYSILRAKNIIAQNQKEDPNASIELVSIKSILANFDPVKIVKKCIILVYRPIVNSDNSFF